MLRSSGSVRFMSCTVQGQKTGFRACQPFLLRRLPAFAPSLPCLQALTRRSAASNIYRGKGTTCWRLSASCMSRPCSLPVWKGGAFARTLDFSKMFVAWILTYLVVTDFQKFRKIIYIQAASVAVIAVISVIKGRGHERLEGVLGGIYSNPNDLAFAIVLSLPFCLAFLVTSKSAVKKLAWLGGMLVMLLALFMTASRGGFIDLVVTGTVCLWYFGVKGRRFYLIVATAFVGILLMSVAGGKLKDRFLAVSGEGIDTSMENRAYGSFEERRFLMIKAVDGIVHYPLLGIGVRNFPNYSGIWKEVHMSYLQIGVEVGIPALILYLLFFWRGFTNLRKIRRRRNLDPEIILFSGALTSSLVGFVVGALFSPEAYQFFPYFAVVFTSALLAMIVEGEREGPIEPAKIRLQSGWLGAAQNDKKDRKKERCTAAKSLIADIAIVNPAVRSNKIDK